MPTIGISVPIPEPWATELQDYRVSLGDEAASHVPTHITLVPPVEVDEGDLPTIEKHLSEVASDVPSYEILLRGTGTFRPVSEVVFVMLATVGWVPHEPHKAKPAPAAISCNAEYTAPADCSRIAGLAAPLSITLGGGENQ